MRQALPKGLVRENVNVPERQSIGFDYMRLQTEASSDSEVTRQAVRHLEQWAEDEKHGIRLGFEKGGHERMFSLETLRDPSDAPKNYRRTSLIFYKRQLKSVEHMRTMLGAKDTSEVIRLALRFYKMLIRMAVAGARFFVVMPDNGERFFIRIITLAKPVVVRAKFGQTADKPKGGAS